VIVLFDGGDFRAHIDHDTRPFVAENGGEQAFRIGA
jgi:hypothetical protein